MPSKSCTSEEKFPLLLLFLEDGQRSSKQHKKIMIDKGRYQGIASGASNVITQWPGQIASCWITAMLFGISLFLVAILMITFTVHPGMQNLTAKCKRNYAEIKNNDSSIIHLVHGPNRWTRPQLCTLEQVAQNNAQLEIELILIYDEIEIPSNIVPRNVVHVSKVANFTLAKTDNGTTTFLSTSTSLKPALRPTQLSRNKTAGTKLKSYVNSRKILEFSINVGTKKLIDMIINQNRIPKTTTKSDATKQPAQKVRTLWEIVKLYPNIKTVRTTFEKVFKHTPLYFTWQNTNIDTRLFAIRVLQLWNFAGISFALPYGEYLCQKDNSTILPSSKPNNVASVKMGSEHLPPGLVTVDDEGLHMETKTTCHAFFGEVLMALTKATRATKPSDVIRHTLHLFCAKGAVDAKYCDTLTG